MGGIMGEERDGRSSLKNHQLVPSPSTIVPSNFGYDATFWTLGQNCQ